MHRVIIPVDFSETSFNAARFTAQMLAGKKDAMAILYHRYEREEDAPVCSQYLETLKKELIEKGDAMVECELEMGGDLIENLDRLSQSRRATLIAMGIAEKTALQQNLSGSNTLKMVDRGICPVMIIPPKAQFNGVSNLAFASDFKNVEMSTPTALINAVLAMFEPNLHIININPEHYVSLTEEYKDGKSMFLEMFKNYKTEFYFIGRSDFYGAIETFVKDYKIDILLVIPRHDSNAFNFFNPSLTKILAYRSQIPLLAAHE